MAAALPDVAAAQVADAYGFQFAARKTPAGELPRFSLLGALNDGYPVFAACPMYYDFFSHFASLLKQAVYRHAAACFPTLCFFDFLTTPFLSA